MTFVGRLKPYQPDAFQRMVDRKKVLLSFDMGLGKTVITIAVIEHLMDDLQIVEPGIIVALSSLKYQWADKIREFTANTSRSLVIDGTPAQRRRQYAQAQDWVNTGIDYIIMNYEQVVNDWDDVRHLPRGFVVLDEATAIKSFRAKRSRRVKRLSDAPIKFALTGSPMENGKPEEIYSIMEFVDKNVLGRSADFDERYIVRNIWGQPAYYRNLSELHERLAPVLVRKRQRDEDVAPYLPYALTEPAIAVPWDRAGAAVYRRVVADLSLDLAEAGREGLGRSWDVLAHYGQGWVGSGSDVQGRIGAKIGVLKMLCSHPALLLSAQGEYVYRLRQDEIWAQVEKAGHNKLSAVVQYVNDHLERDDRNKIVIFAHYLEMSDILHKALAKHHPEIYSGRMNARQKHQAQTRFQQRPDARVLVSTDAGGYGIDLPEANLVINYDLPDTSGAMVQRNSRIIRASSDWPMIKVQDFVMKDSIEQRQLDVLSQKNSVQSAVLDGIESGKTITTVDNLSKFLATTRV